MCVFQLQIDLISIIERIHTCSNERDITGTIHYFTYTRSRNTYRVRRSNAFYVFVL